MSETTTQQDATTADEVRDILLELAEQLGEGPHCRVFTETDRLSHILAAVQAWYGYSTAALNVDRAVRQAAPAIEWEMTRGEYALILRRAAGGDR